MEAANSPHKLNDFAFYTLMGILGFSIVFTVGFLLYSAIFS
jgi:hypothetical protein